MKYMLFAILMLVSGITLGSNYNESGPGPIQDHSCQGGHNCNTYGHGTDTTQGQTQDQSQGQAQAQAQDQSQGQSQGQVQQANSESSSISIADASNRNSNESSNTNLNYSAGGQGGQGGNAYSSQGNSQSITFEAPAAPRRFGNNVNAFAPAIYSSSACTGGGLSAGASAVGMGVSLGGAKQDKQCQVRENARILSGLDTNLAILYLCANPLVDVGSVLGSACKPAEAPELVPHPDPAPDPAPIPVPHIDDSVKG